MNLDFTPVHHRSHLSHTGLVWHRYSAASSIDADIERSRLVRAGQVVVQSADTMPMRPKKGASGMEVVFVLTCMTLLVSWSLGYAILTRLIPDGLDFGAVTLVSVVAPILVGALLLMLFGFLGTILMALSIPKL